MRPVAVDEDAVVRLVVTEAGDVATLLDDEAVPAELARGPLGDDATDRTGADDEQVAGGRGMGFDDPSPRITNGGS